MDIQIPDVLSPDLFQQMQTTFLAALKVFKDSSDYHCDGGFDPYIATKATYEQAIPPLGPEHVLIRFFFFVTDLSDLKQALDFLQNALDNQESGQITSRIQSWATLLCHAFLAPMSSRPGSTALETPKNFKPTEKYKHVATPRRISENAKACRERDHHRCVVTGSYDTGRANELLRENIEAKDQDGNLIANLSQAYLECAHIIPHSVNDSSRGMSELERHKRFTRDLLNMFDPGILAFLEGAEVDHLRNVICLEKNIHASFGNLTVALESASDWGPNNHHYRIANYKLGRYPGIEKIRSEVKLFNDVDVAMPSRRFLDLHAACARIAHMSGAAELILKLQRDLGSDGVKSDGSTRLGDVVAARLYGLEIPAF